MGKIASAAWMGITVGLGFAAPDYFKGTFDRADVAVPMVAFLVSLLTSIVREK